MKHVAYFKTTIQLHASKLWFAAKAENWDLAKYELDELKETMKAPKALNEKKRSQNFKGFGFRPPDPDHPDGRIHEAQEFSRISKIVRRDAQRVQWMPHRVRPQVYLHRPAQRSARNQPAVVNSNIWRKPW